MPAAIAIPAIATAIAGGTAATASIYGAKKQASANKDAAAASERSNAAAIEEQKRQDAEAKRQFDAQQATQQAQWNAQQQLLAAQDARRVPYRAASQSALFRLGDLIGTDFRSNAGNDPGAAAMAAAAKVAPVNQPMSTLIQPPTTSSTPVIPIPSRQPQMVTLMAPTGKTSQVPASQAAHYISLGAKQVA